MARHDDTEIVETARMGDQAAFAEIVHLYKNVVFSLAFAATGSTADSDDVVQQVFITAWEQLPRLESPEALRAWLCGITRNMVRRLAKRRARHSSDEALPDLGGDREPASPALSPADHAIARETERLLDSALGRLPERYRIPLLLHYREQWSVEEVAEGLGVEQDAIRQRLTRGRRMLRGRMEALTGARGPLGPRSSVVAAVLATIAATQGRGAQAGPRPRAPAAVKPGASAKMALVLSAAAGVALVVGLAALGTRRRAAKPDARPIAADRMPPNASAIRARVPIFAAAAAPSGAQHEQPAALLEFDFDDGVAPTATDYGHVSYCPPRPGNPHCMLADLAVEKGGRSDRAYWAAIFRARPALFNYSETTVLAFDYFLEVDDGPLFAKVTVPDGPEYQVAIPHPVRRAWGHAEVPLRTTRRGPEPPPPGPIVKLSLFTYADQLDRPLYIDTVRVFDRVQGANGALASDAPP